MDNRYYIHDENQRLRCTPSALPPNARLYLLELQKGEPGQCSGYIHNLYSKAPIYFRDFTHAVLQMDRFMDTIQCPQADTERRSMMDRPRTAEEEKQADLDWLNQERKLIEQYWMPSSFLHAKERQGTFYIRVLYRQHSSWQGEVIWKGTNKNYFRSVLELIHLMADAVQRQKL